MSVRPKDFSTGGGTGMDEITYAQSDLSLIANDTSSAVATSNSTALNNALSGVTTGSKIIDFEPGTYNFDQIILPSKGTLKAHYHGLTRLQAGSNTYGALIESDQYNAMSGTGTSVLKTTLIASWNMDVVSGNQTDEHTNGLTLTDNNSVGSGAGIISTARTFNGTNQFLSRASEALLQTGAIDFTFEAWVKLNTLASDQAIIAKEVSGAREYLLFYNSSTGQFNFNVYNGVSTLVGTAVSSLTISTATWYQIICHVNYGSDQKTANIQVNTPSSFGTPVSSALTGTPATTTSAFTIGASSFVGSEKYLNGLIDNVRFWKRKLNFWEKKSLYASGASLAFASFNSAGSNERHDLDGGIVIPMIRDLVLSGNTDMSFITPEPYVDNVGYEDVADAIRLFASAPLVENVYIGNFRGAGICVSRSSASLFSNTITPVDFAKPRFINVSINKCFQGIVVNAVDTDINGLEAFQIRDQAIYIQTGATQVTGVHAYGCGTGIEIEDSAGRCFLNQIEVENSTYGIVVGSSCHGTEISNLVAFEFTTAAVVSSSTLLISNAYINVRTATIGIQLTASDSIIEGARIDIAGTGIGIDLGAGCQRTRIDAYTYGGTGLHINSSGISDCHIKITVGGATTGVDIDAIGTSNVIEIISAGSLTNPVTYPGGGTAFNIDISNRIYVNGVLYGVQYLAGALSGIEWQDRDGSGAFQLYHDTGNFRWWNGTKDTFKTDTNGRTYVLQGTGSSYGKVGGTIFSHYADAGNSTTTETDIFSDTIPASSLGTDGDSLEAEYTFAVLGHATATSQFKIYFGGTGFYDSTAFTSATNYDIHFRVRVTRISSSATRNVVTMFNTANLAGPSYCTYTAQSGLTLSNTNILKITAQRGAAGAATNDIVGKFSTVRWQSVA